MSEQKEPKTSISLSIPVESGNSFTVETRADKTNSSIEIPSVTRLLNRKSLKAPQKQSPASAFTVDSRTPANESEPSHESPSLMIMASPEIVLSNDSQANDSAQSSPEALKAQGRERQNQIQTWSLSTLQNSRSSNLKAISSILSQSGDCIVGFLFLSVIPPQTGQKLPLFKAKAGQGPKELFGFWKGLVWNPLGQFTGKELWKALVEQGWIETTNAQKQFNLARTALGVGSSQILTLIRIGSVKKCKGLFAIVSSQSVQTQILEHLKKIHEDVEVTKINQAA